MAGEVKRLNYFRGQFLRENDFIDEQAYHLSHQRDHARLLHTPGIAEGLDVLAPPAGSTSVTVQAGVAYDDLGRRIVLPDNRSVDLAGIAAGATVFITIAYAEQQSDATNETGVSGNTRWTEAPVVATATSAPADPNRQLVLAQVSRTGTTVTGVDTSARLRAGVKGGDLAVNSLTMRSDAIAQAGWVRMNLGASGRADVAGSVRVTGNVEVTGTVDGRDVSADGTRLDAHLASTANPHNTTAAQVGALPIAGGTVTGNLQVNGTMGVTGLTTTTNVQVNGNVGVTGTVDGRDVSADGANLDAHRAATTNPHSTTAAQVGALAITGGTVTGAVQVNGNIGVTGTVDGRDVSVDGANLDTHRTATNNPHSTTAAQVGALATTGGTVSGPLTVTGATLLANGATFGQSTGPSNAFAQIANPLGQNVALYVTGGTGAGVSTGLRTTVLIWPLIDGVNALQVFGSTGGVDTAVFGGTVRFGGTKVGYVADTFVNGSDQTLRTGDIVKLKAGGKMAFHGDNNTIPIPEVTVSDKADDPLVMGIVGHEATPAPDEPDDRAEPDDPTSIPPGGKLFVITLGTFAHCKVDATRDRIEVGDLLTSSDNAGHAKKATDPKVGTIIGKALQPIEGKIGYIAVFVNIQ